MISPSSLTSALNLAAAAADLALDTASPAARSAGTARATYVPSSGELATVIGKVVESAITGARRSSRSTSTSRKSKTSRPPAAGYASAKPKAKSSASDPLSFLKDPKLSIEEKLMRLLAYLNDKWEKEMQKKMEQAAGKTSSTAKSSSSKKKGGLLGSLGGILKSALGPAGIAFEALKIPAVRSFLSKVGGPVLAAGATALGFPQAAPLLLKHGSKIVELAAGVASSLDSAAESSSASSAKTAATGETGKVDQLALMDLQRMYDKQKEMFGLVSNILKAGHDTRMSIVNNIR